MFFRLLCKDNSSLFFVKGKVFFFNTVFCNSNCTVNCFGSNVKITAVLLIIDIEYEISAADEINIEDDSERGKTV